MVGKLIKAKAYEKNKFEKKKKKKKKRRNTFLKKKYFN